MLREVLYGQTSMPILKNALDAQTMRQKALASNIVNVEVPGYTPRRVTFEERLSRALGNPNNKLVMSHSNHMPYQPDPKSVKPLIVEDEDAVNPAGTNAVDIDQQMTRLATNSIHYQLTAKRAAGLFNKIRTLTHLP
ncbi:flagellar basal body rod protein FlgB [bacterium]|nr:flagellar basal body rod protein FlgB [bacterium]